MTKFYSPRAVLFDMDGTVFDTERIGVEAWQFVGKQLKLPITETLAMSCIGFTEVMTKEMLFQAVGPFDYELAAEHYRWFITRYVTEHGVPIKKGLLQLLEFSEAAGIAKALATSSHAEIVQYYLESAHLEGRFDYVITGEQVSHGKPDPEIFVKAAGHLGVKPDECLVLEDSACGIQAASAAGMRVVFIPDLTAPDQNTLSKAFCQVESLQEVIPLLASSMINTKEKNDEWNSNS